MKFNSRICTTKEQSERLLKLGLKPETADYIHFAKSKSYHGTDIPTRDRRYNLVLFFQDEIPIINHEEYEYIPAWSLHRLIEIYKDVEDTSMWSLENVNYNRLIQCISLAVKHGAFNKEYLKQ